MNNRLLSVLLMQSVVALVVRASIYIINPTDGSTCSGGQSCTVEWLDDGTQPLLTDIGACHVALYNGDRILIQQINPVDVSAQHALTFTPDPRAGPNSGSYYINFTSVGQVEGATYFQFSTMFTVDSMTGSLDSPVASDTAEIPVPPALTASKSTTSQITITSNSPSSAPSTPSSTSSAVVTPSSNNQSSGSSSTSGSASGSTTRSTGARSSSTLITLTVSASSTSNIISPVSAPAAPSSSDTGVNQPGNGGSRAASTPLFLCSIVVLAFGLLM